MTTAATTPYLYLSEEAPWPRAAGPVRLGRLGRLPEALKETTAQGVERIRPQRPQGRPGAGLRRFRRMHRPGG